MLYKKTNGNNKQQTTDQHSRGCFARRGRVQERKHWGQSPKGTRKHAQRPRQTEALGSGSGNTGGRTKRGTIARFNLCLFRTAAPHFLVFIFSINFKV